MKNNKCIFIVPYFGKLPNTFPLFLKSCEENPKFNWLILTDDTSKYNYPSNVKVIKKNFSEFKKDIQKHFDFKICLDSYQKLCDYKPVYGLVLEKLIARYEFWGYCDIDVIFGRISDFLTEDILSKNDKFFQMGHCTVFRNTHENNRLFMRKYKGVLEYKKSFTTNKVTIFDEVYGGSIDIDDLFAFYSKKIYKRNVAFDIQPGVLGFQNANYDYNEKKYLYELHYWNKLCVWDNGQVKRIFLENNEIKTLNYMYVHLQDRKINWSVKCLDTDQWQIIPEFIKPIDLGKITPTKLKLMLKFNVDFNTLDYFCLRSLAKIKHWVGK